jgi:phosphate transport system ATP-binding protein
MIQTRALSVFAGSKQLLRNVSIRVESNQIFGIIGPSGAGKSTMLRCLNRLIELDPGLRVEGAIELDGASIFDPAIDVDALRARVGIIFQQPVVFPVSIYKNVLFGVRHLGREPRSQWPAVAERALRESALWDEVKNRLDESATKLSVGQQQRLCLARALAVNPEILLMDEPTSALDLTSTELIEDLILRLKQQHTIILVTHNLSQALRVADTVARTAMRDEAGEVVDCGPAAAVISRAPSREETDDFHPVSEIKLPTKVKSHETTNRS